MTTKSPAARIRAAIVKLNPTVTVHELYQHEGRWIAQYTAGSVSADLFVPATPARAAAAVKADLEAR